MVTRARGVKQGSLDPVGTFRKISAAKKPPQRNRVSGGDRYKVATTGFKTKYAGTGPIRAGRFATTAPVVASTDPRGSTYRVELLANVLSNPHPTEHEGNLLAMALIDSVPA